jgi:proliferating cell nuclear antigen
MTYIGDFSDEEKTRLEDMVFYFQTVKTNDFKSIFDSLKDVLFETNITVDEDGLTIVNSDKSDTAMITVKLDANKFDKYYCAKKLRIGIMVISFYKYLRCVTTDDVLTIYMEKNTTRNVDNESKIIIRLDNEKKNKMINNIFMLSEVDINEKIMELSMQNQEDDYLCKYDFVITMPSGEFQKTVKDIYNISDEEESEILILCHNNVLSFKYKGDIGERVISHTINDVDPDEDDDDEHDKHDTTTFRHIESDNNVFQGLFKLKFLHMSSKCTSMGSTMEICMKNETPLRISFKSGDLGCLQIILTPKIEDLAYFQGNQENDEYDEYDDDYNEES